MAHKQMGRNIYQSALCYSRMFTQIEVTFGREKSSVHI
uniref:Uncharacterized protein n=1 Tax=Arundo donax TaxID=35708 RepID=A0A0A9H7I9_ARUDO